VIDFEIRRPPSRNVQTLVSYSSENRRAIDTGFRVYEAKYLAHVNRFSRQLCKLPHCRDRIFYDAVVTPAPSPLPLPICQKLLHFFRGPPNPFLASASFRSLGLPQKPLILFSLFDHPTGTLIGKWRPLPSPQSPMIRGIPIAELPCFSPRGRPRNHSNPTYGILLKRGKLEIERKKAAAATVTIRPRLEV
jgi:hypothetical protein